MAVRYEGAGGAQWVGLTLVRQLIEAKWVGGQRFRVRRTIGVWQIAAK